MFTLSKSCPEISISENNLLELGSKLRDIGGRVLLICSTTEKDKISIDKFKNTLKQLNITFIQNILKNKFITHKDLGELQERAENFNVSIVISLGSTNERMCGRVIAERLSLYYFELPTTYYNPYLLVPEAIISNNIGTDFDKVYISEDRISGIIIDKSLLRTQDDYDIALNGISMLFILAHIIYSDNNNFVSKTEAQNLYIRLLNDIDNSQLTTESLYRYGLTVELLFGTMSNPSLDYLIFSWLACSRFACSENLLNAKLLPWLIDIHDDKDLFSITRELIDKVGITGRLKDLGYTINQLKEICKDNYMVAKLVEKAF